MKLIETQKLSKDLIFRRDKKCYEQAIEITALLSPVLTKYNF